jgi:hypothetical protein
MFAPGYFNHYERMTVGFYGSPFADLPPLGRFQNMQDIKEYVELLAPLNKTNAHLRT